jgi:hypothetical protein
MADPQKSAKWKHYFTLLLFFGLGLFNTVGDLYSMKWFSDFKEEALEAKALITNISREKSYRQKAYYTVSVLYKTETGLHRSSLKSHYFAVDDGIFSGLKKWQSLTIYYKPKNVHKIYTERKLYKAEFIFYGLLPILGGFIILFCGPTCQQIKDNKHS